MRAHFFSRVQGRLNLKNNRIAAVLYHVKRNGKGKVEHQTQTHVSKSHQTTEEEKKEKRKSFLKQSTRQSAEIFSGKIMVSSLRPSPKLSSYLRSARFAKLRTQTFPDHAQGDMLPDCPLLGPASAGTTCRERHANLVCVCPWSRTARRRRSPGRSR